MRDAYLLLFVAPGDGDRLTGSYGTHNPKIQNLRAFGNARRKSPLPGLDRHLLLGRQGHLCLWSTRSMAGILLPRGVRFVRPQ